MYFCGWETHRRELGHEHFPESTGLAGANRAATFCRMSAVLETSEAAILGRVFKPETGGWPRAAAEAILGVAFDSEDRDRMIALLERAKAGELSNEEAEELEHYRHVGRLLELMKSRARRSLQITPAG